MYFIPQGYGLADEAVEDAIYDSQALRDFCGIHLGQESVPDATTLMNFRHLQKVRYKGLAKNDAQLNRLFALGNLYLARGKLCPS